MFETKVTFAEGQTPEQRKAHVAYWRRKDAQRRGLNNALGFWRLCGTPRCRRNRTCSGDMHACFARLWPLVPDEQKEYLRGCARAVNGDGDLSMDAVDRAGRAAREEYLKRMAERARPPAAVVPVSPDVAIAPQPEARIRRL